MPSDSLNPYILISDLCMPTYKSPMKDPYVSGISTLRICDTARVIRRIRADVAVGGLRMYCSAENTMSSCPCAKTRALARVNSSSLSLDTHDSRSAAGSVENGGTEIPGARFRIRGNSFCTISRVSGGLEFGT